MAFCGRCQREFNTSRGLDIHLNRIHPVSDNYVLDFMNLSEASRESVLCSAEGYDEGTQAFIKQKYADPAEQTKVFTEIITNPLDIDRLARLKEALSLSTGVEYRYTIQEEP